MRFACATALTVSLGATAMAFQNPPAPTPQQEKPAISGAANDPSAIVTVEGCLVRETDVPGRAVPEEVRKQVVSDADYVLTDTKMIKGSQPEPPASAKPADTPIGTSGTAAPLMYKVKGEDLKMGDHAGRRVQIDGSFEHADRAANPVAFAYDLVRLNGVAIREVPGECPKQ